MHSERRERKSSIFKPSIFNPPCRSGGYLKYDIAKIITLHL
jgi:hypothetical protein